MCYKVKKLLLEVSSYNKILIAKDVWRYMLFKYFKGAGGVAEGIGPEFKPQY
jgi:hypothetical protein